MQVFVISILPIFQFFLLSVSISSVSEQISIRTDG